MEVEIINYCPICEKNMDGATMFIEKRLYFVCKNGHKTLIKTEEEMRDANQNT